MSSENLDAAAAFLKQFVMAHQQQQQSSVGQQPPPQAAALQQLLRAAQQQQQRQQHQPASTSQSQAYPQHDPNMARLLTDVLSQQQQQTGSQKATSLVAPPQQSFHMSSLQQRNEQPSPLQQQSLLSSAQLLGSLHASLAAALMSKALQQSAGVPNQDQAAAPPSSTSTLPSSSAPASAPLQQQQQHRSPPPNHPITKMQRWTLEQLESHAKELTDGGWPMPQAVSLLLADARRKEQKRQAKRIANRKSACTSRARKKAQIDQLMSDNARLRRQEMILSYLPDPVMVISPQGTITFCNKQVESVFRHKIGELESANIEDLMIPRSRGVMKKLIREVMIAEQEVSGDGISERESGSSGGYLQNKMSETESAFPMLEVKLNSEDVDAGEDVSDSDENRRHTPNKSSQATATEISSLTHKDSSFHTVEGDDVTHPDKNAKAAKKMNSSESDGSQSLEKEKRNADDNLSKNVEACKFNTDKAKTEQVRFSHKDDVMGASVTANNADAKLSSLMHEPSLKVKHMMGPKRTAHKQDEQSSSTMDSSISKTSSDKAQVKGGNSSEDSGYRESGESPEDSNSSSSGAIFARTSKEEGKRARPIAPSRNVCVIRSDLSTIWCELTASVRNSVTQLDTERGSEAKEDSVEEQESKEPEKELLLCFRPLREGEKVSPKFRFKPAIISTKKPSDSSDVSTPKIHGVSETNGSSGSGSGSSGDGANATSTSNGADARSSTDPSAAETQMDVDTSDSMQLNKKQPKKRACENQEAVESNKKNRPSSVELMLGLSKKPSYR